MLFAKLLGSPHPRARVRTEYADARPSAHEELPLVGVRMPVQFLQRSRLKLHVNRGERRLDGEFLG